MQGELFEPPTMLLREAVLGRNGVVPLIVIGCGRKKRQEAAPADQLYTSDRFKSCINLVRSLGAPYAILSGKHGIVAGEMVIAPYDLHLPDLPEANQRDWAEQVLDALAARAESRQVTLLAANEYSMPLLELNRARASPLDIVAPWLGLEYSDHAIWLAEAKRMAARIQDLDRLYNWIGEERIADRVFSFRELSSRSVPKRGVYIFLDGAERNFRGAGFRVVRIGTHAVSAGSQASLRGRLRNHLGPSSQIGNHRGSIFRLHIGIAMLEAGPGHGSLATWGEGQDARPEVKSLEIAHELAVSRYLQDLEVVLLEVDDEPSKESLRAKVEMQLIALFSESMRTIDCPGPDWLGLKSPVAQIRQSGLWNIRGIGGKYDPAAAGSVASIFRGLNNG
ncbi:hypothetical protein J1C56_30415 [Aminobacter anthyllidis]|uniref:GIY-YIG nuclease family protein n=1 Tax=Aminobacter anthyllidis TaxID=1035067 RepID=A0A9X1AHK5_9HYPH|nr:DUF6884 domain-containing protein [Aminobacter anthyllidis]MBT1159863.1 hypothetical protein [Aminobacter anthyllidis]